MILYIENPKDSARIRLETISKYSKGSGYKINVQKSIAFLYSNNEVSEKEVEKIIPLAIATKNNSFCNCNKKNKIPRNKFNET